MCIFADYYNDDLFMIIKLFLKNNLKQHLPLKQTVLKREINIPQISF